MIILIPLLSIPLALALTFCLNLYGNWHHTIADQTRLEATAYSVCFHRQHYIEKRILPWNKAILGNRVALEATAVTCDALAAIPGVNAASISTCRATMKAETLLGEGFEIVQNLERLVGYRLSEKEFEKDISTRNKLLSHGIYESFSPMTSLIPNLSAGGSSDLQKELSGARSQNDQNQKDLEGFKNIRNLRGDAKQERIDQLNQKGEDIKKQSAELKEKIGSLGGGSGGFSESIFKTYPDGFHRKREDNQAMAMHVKTWGGELPHVLEVEDPQKFEKTNRYEFRYFPQRRLIGVDSNPNQNSGELEDQLAGGMNTRAYQVEGRFALSRTSSTCCLYGESEDSMTADSKFKMKPEGNCADPGLSAGRAVSDGMNLARGWNDPQPLSEAKEDHDMREESDEP